MKQRVVVFLFLILLISVPLFPEAAAVSRTDEAKSKLELVENLYASGDYEECRNLLDSYISEAQTNEAYFPKTIIARIYSLRALISYAFRGEGEEYIEEINELLLKAVEKDPYLDIGDPAEIPPLILKLFSDIKEQYLSQFSRSSRRISLGLLGALVIDPTVLGDPSLLQPGFFFGYNLSEILSLGFELRFPLSLPIWGSIRGQLGLMWYPSFKVGKISTSISTFYLFSLDDLSTYTHSISFAGQAEVVFRSGIGLAIRAELMRIDLILGLTDPAKLPTYESTKLGESFLRLAFANMNFYIFYTF